MLPAFEFLLSAQKRELSWFLMSFPTAQIVFLCIWDEKTWKFSLLSGRYSLASGTRISIVRFLVIFYTAQIIFLCIWDEKTWKFSLLSGPGFDWYDHTDADYPVWIHMKPIPIILFGLISNRYRYICLAPYQTDFTFNIGYFHRFRFWHPPYPYRYQLSCLDLY